MTKIALLLLFSPALMPAVAADTPSVSGRWKVHNNFSGYESDTICTINQKDAELTGSCKSENGEGAVHGKVDAAKVTWSYNSQYNGTPVVVKYTGTFSPAAKTITGSAYVEQFSSDGEFTATLAK